MRQKVLAKIGGRIDVSPYAARYDKQRTTVGIFQCWFWPIRLCDAQFGTVIVDRYWYRHGIISCSSSMVFVIGRHPVLLSLTPRANDRVATCEQGFRSRLAAFTF